MDEGSRHRRRPGRPLLRDPREEGLAADAHHRVRAQPARRHLRLRRRVLGRDARHLRGVRPRELPRHRRPLRLLGRHRNPFPWDDAPHRRQRVLRVLARHAVEDLGRRARSLGVEIKYQSEISPLDPINRDADLVVVADGINSRMREAFAGKFKPSVDLRPNFFSWMGSTRPFDAFTFFFRETEHGIFIGHCYQYEPQRSTWITETDPHTFARAGLDKLDEAASARFVEGLFAKELQGHRLITNRSIWRNFPTIRCERWVADNMVLLGDAKATAHFSIGSGTKLAMEDGIALYEAFRSTGGRD